MSILKAYLSESNTKRVLNRKPGDKGFSLIELVVVVAVLAILSAIAIPSFTSINGKARAAAASNTLATVVKECATEIADTGAGAYIVPTLDGYRGGNTKGWSVDGGTNILAAASSQTCLETGSYTLISDDNAKYPSFSYNVGTGAKTCTASSTALTRGCPVSGGAW